jgi:hypothetical protein
MDRLDFASAVAQEKFATPLHLPAYFLRDPLLLLLLRPSAQRKDKDRGAQEEEEEEDQARCATLTPPCTWSAVPWSVRRGFFFGCRPARPPLRSIACPLPEGSAAAWGWGKQKQKGQRPLEGARVRCPPGEQPTHALPLLSRTGSASMAMHQRPVREAFLPRLP